MLVVIIGGVAPPLSPRAGLASPSARAPYCPAISYEPSFPFVRRDSSQRVRVAVDSRGEEFALRQPRRLFDSLLSRGSFGRHDG